MKKAQRAAMQELIKVHSASTGFNKEQGFLLRQFLLICLRIRMKKQITFLKEFLINEKVIIYWFYQRKISQQTNPIRRIFIPNRLTIKSRETTQPIEIFRALK